MALPAENQRYTYSDYYEWNDGKRWELFEGIPYAMSPAPTWRHQGIVGNLHMQLAVFLKGKSCKVFPAPIDVRLNADAYDDTVVQPDITVVCDLSKLDDKGSCTGAPTMVIEVLSPSTSKKDRSTKMRLYQKAGVCEYWIVDPDSYTIMVHILENGKYTITAYDDESDDAIPVHTLAGCVIRLSDVFEQ